MTRANSVRISCSYNDGKSPKNWNPLSFSPVVCHSSAKPSQCFLTCSAFCFEVTKLWYTVRGFSEWQDYKMPETSLVVPLKLSLNTFLFDTNCSWRVGGKLDPTNSSNSCESWEVHSSLRIWHKNLANNEANFLFSIFNGENKEHMYPHLIFGAHPQSQQINFIDYARQVNKYFLGNLFLPSPTTI